MFGIIFGVACLAGLYHLNRGGGDCHHAGHSHAAWRGRHHRRPFGGFGRRAVDHKLKQAMRAVDASPEQQREIRAAFDGLRSEVKALRGALRSSPRDLAEALREDTLHEERVEVVFSQQQEALEGVQGALKRALDKLHATLDPVQRSQIADFFARQTPSPAGPYR